MAPSLILSICDLWGALPWLPDDMVDDDGVGGQQEVGEALGDLGELETRTVEDLERRGDC